MIRACIFDLDGTLANTLESMAYAANTILAQFGLKQLPTENFRYYCGDGASVLVRRVLQAAGDEKLTCYEKMEPLYREIFRRDPLYHVSHYPGIPEVLADMKQCGVRLAVCSNKPHEATKKVITGMFGDTFDAVLGQQPGLPLKPAPDGALRLAAELGVQPGECVYIGDTHTDMETGSAAGMITVGVLWGYRDREELLKSGAVFLAETPADLGKFIFPDGFPEGSRFRRSTPKDEDDLPAEDIFL